MHWGLCIHLNLFDFSLRPFGRVAQLFNFARCFHTVCCSKIHMVVGSLIPRLLLDFGFAFISDLLKLHIVAHSASPPFYQCCSISFTIKWYDLNSFDFNFVFFFVFFIFCSLLLAAVSLNSSCCLIWLHGNNSLLSSCWRRERERKKESEKSNKHEIRRAQIGLFCLRKCECQRECECECN